MVNARKLQRVWVGFKGRQRARARKLEILYNAAALTIQRTVRGYLGRQRVKSILVYRQQYVAAITLQRHLRGVMGRKRYQVAILERKACRMRQAAVFVIQKYYRYYLGRKLGSTVRTYCLEMNMATVLRTAWRNYLVKKFGWASIRYKLEHNMTRRLQRMYSFWKTRKTIREHLKSLRENVNALVIQRVFRGHVGRKRSRQRRRYLLETKAATRIQKGWHVYIAGKLLRLAKEHARLEKAAVIIQSRFRCFTTRRRYLQRLFELGQYNAAVAIQSQFRVYRARRRLKRKLWVNANGPCQECYDELADRYSFYFELEICKSCLEIVVNYELAEEDDYDSDDSFHVVKKSPVECKESIPIDLYRTQTKYAITIQATYRGKQARCALHFGCCAECSQPRKMYCYDCKHHLCHGCDAMLHDHSSFDAHHRVNNQVHLMHIEKAILIQAQYVKYLFKLVNFNVFLGFVVGCNAIPSLSYSSRN